MRAPSRRVPSILERARGRCGFTRCTMAEGGGPESGNASDPDEKPVIAQTPVPSTESQKQSIGTLLKRHFERETSGKRFLCEAEVKERLSVSAQAY